MVDISGYIDDGDDGDGGEAEDLAALKACLQALADAVASTNLAIVASGYQSPAASQRIEASMKALKRFSEAFAVLNPTEAAEDPGATEDDDDD